MKNIVSFIINRLEKPRLKKSGNSSCQYTEGFSPKTMRVVDPWAKLCNNHFKERFVRERRKRGALCSFLLFLVGLSVCLAVFPKENMRECDVDVSLPQLTLHPEEYMGRKVLLGGQNIEQN
jgi:hypothetical protein